MSKFFSLEQLRIALTERLKLPLPGGDAHEHFRAHPVGDVRPLFDHKLPPKPGGVIILLYDDHGTIKFPLTKRADYPGAHGGQVSLPGGKGEQGETVIQTAVRECREEIGITADQFEVIGTLSDFFVMPSNFMVTPVVAMMKISPAFKPDPYEVARIITGDLIDLLSDNAMRQKEIIAAGKYRMNAPHFEIDGEIVWGATAMMLNELRIIIRELYPEMIAKI
jgi:8-oxo-dGTP pyrophosphatase MutT (NUDIX family)